jgi:hypothetical protein
MALKTTSSALATTAVMAMAEYVPAATRSTYATPLRLSCWTEPFSAGLAADDPAGEEPTCSRDVSRKLSLP